MIRPFQKLTIVRLITPKTPVPDTPEDEAIHAAHVNYLKSLGDQGIILANGPVRRHDSTEVRGMGLYLVDIEEARRLAHLDPAVQKGWFEVQCDEWLIPVRPRTIADKTDLELDVPF